jgi:NADPH:quinone reductase-like Zn-dependent oxidoreductase
LFIRKNIKNYFISFSGITFNDVLVRYGLLEDSPRPPFVPGFECSGEVLDIGTNVTHVDVSFKLSILFF